LDERGIAAMVYTQMPKEMMRVRRVAEILAQALSASKNYDILQFTSTFLLFFCPIFLPSYSYLNRPV
jgi:hypothetical protein